MRKSKVIYIGNEKTYFATSASFGIIPGNSLVHGQKKCAIQCFWFCTPFSDKFSFKSISISIKVDLIFHYTGGAPRRCKDNRRTFLLSMDQTITWNNAKRSWGKLKSSIWKSVEEVCCAKHKPNVGTNQRTDGQMCIMGHKN
jgi:hypothetical protein